MKTLIVILVLFSSSVFAETPNFIADCTTNQSHYYWDGLNLGGERMNTMYDENVKPNFKFDYVGGEYIYIDDEKKGLIVKELEDIVIFIELTSNMNAATLMSYSINFKSGDAIATHNNTSVVGESTQTKAGLLKLNCNIVTLK
jgi:hypothetical protein